MTFKTWINTLIEEKGIDLEEFFEVIDAQGTPNFFTYGVIIEAACGAGKAEQKQIKNKLVFLDFKNADIKHFLRFLGEGLAAARLRDRQEA